MRYLSTEWMDAACRALDAGADDEARQAVLAGVTLTVEQVVLPSNDPRSTVDPSTGVPATDGPSPSEPSTGVPSTSPRTAEGEPVRWHVTIADGRAALVPGAADHPDLRFTTDYATAAAIAAGTLSAQRAFVEGRLRVGGDLSLLIAHQRAIAAVDDVLAPVRDQTTYA